MMPSELNPALGQVRSAVRRRAALASAIAAVLAGVPAAHADTAATAAKDVGALDEVVVTAEKRSENLQDVPVSITAIGAEKLEQLGITGIDTYVQNLSGVTTVKGLGQGGNGVGTTHVYMRGIVSGQDGNHSGSQPSVGTYFDEQPITTIDGTPDIHTYDIARIEVLEGPQGTLYGASSEAGTIRVISNKPEIGKWAAGYDVTGNEVAHGGPGSIFEGFANIPLGDIAAVRLVGWDEHDSGYISNVAGTNLTAGIADGQRTYPTWSGATGETQSNAGSVSSHYNTEDVVGGRALLKVLLGDNWTATAMQQMQTTRANGNFGYDPVVGDLELVHFGPESYYDQLSQTTLTIEGKVNNFDITYAGGWQTRNTHTIADYSDYSYFYDHYFASGCNWLTQAGYNANVASNGGVVAGCKTGNYGSPSYYAEPQEFVLTNGHFTKWNHEFRISTPQDLPVKATVGVFVERQTHEIWEQYTIPGEGGNPLTQNPQGLASSLSIPGVNGNTIWLTDQERVDRDQAAFGQVEWDITQNWSVNGGLRFYKYDNSLQGFYGFSEAYDLLTGYYPGQNICGPSGSTTAQPTYQPFHGAPCTDLNNSVTDSGRTYKANVTYKFDQDHLLYATYSTGYRPGGVNRVYDSFINAVFPPYKADTLVNYEIGWKTQTADHRLRWNGAVFLENWDNFQFLFLGPNSVTVVQNAASAQIRGIESELEWAAGGGLTLGGNLTFLHAVTTANYCGPEATIPGTANLSTNCPNQVNSYADGNGPNGPESPSGSDLPVAPKFKISVNARYVFPVADSIDGFLQASGMYQTGTEPLLRLIDQEQLGSMPAYALVNLAGGISKDRTTLQLSVNNVFDKRAELTRYVECATTTCGPQPYVIPSQPRTVAIKFGQKF